MKKSLLALAVLGAFASAAQAQSSVTIYGSIDGGIRNKTNVNAAGDSQLLAGSGTYSSNRLGFKGVEDLGGGLNAHFTLEGGYSSKTGALSLTNTLFDRGASVGVGGPWGSVDLGLQYSVAFKVIAAYDPFNYKYPTIIPVSTAAAGNQVNLGVTGAIGGSRFNNDIQYTGTFGPITARAEYALGEQAGSTSNAAAQAVGASYTGGPFSVGLAYTQRKPAVVTATNFQDNKQWTIGGAYTGGPFNVAIGYIDEKQDFGGVTGQGKIRNAWLGGSYNFTPAMALTAGYYQTKTTAPGVTDTKRRLFIVGGTYALSKRTNFYVDVDNTRFDGGFGTLGGVQAVGVAYAQPAVNQDRQTGISVGIHHLF
ncbi:MAG: hypothetical protein JWQ21_2559 [Herminiimonas sp.]|nr:hypothetical protein [Herminiimonas sp.]